MSRVHLVELGFSSRRIMTLLAHGHLIRIHRGVYAVGHGRLTVQGRWMGSVLACGADARLSHGDALALYDMRRAGTGVVHVTAPSAHRIPGVCCHTARAALGDAVVDAIPVTSLERAVLDCAATLSLQRVRSVLEEMERRDRFDLRLLEAELQAGNGHRGVGRVRAALAELSPTPPALRSGLERRFLEGVRAAGLPEPSVNVVLDDELYDFRWPEANVIAEIDSWSHHRGRSRFAADRRMTNVAARAGQTLLRFTDDQILEDLAAVIAEVARALSHAG